MSSHTGEQYWCPEDDGDDLGDFGSRLALDVHYSTTHLDTGLPVALSIAGRYGLPSDPEAYARVLKDLRLFVADENPDFHGALVVPNSHGWGMLGAAAGIGQGLPQARYVVWSQGTPIAWYLNDSTDEGWVFPTGDYYAYDRITSRHQNKIGAALQLLGAEV